jgi:hypothetical protein
MQRSLVTLKSMQSLKDHSAPSVHSRHPVQMGSDDQAYLRASMVASVGETDWDLAATQFAQNYVVLKTVFH